MGPSMWVDSKRDEDPPLTGVVRRNVQTCSNLVYQVEICGEELQDKVLVFVTYVYTAVAGCAVYTTGFSEPWAS